ncbi:MAG: hypothetical protein KC912_08525 [Proteobacteria bacterium]|nr:hypothetical protein [Pseudomonadota bacterium]
MQRLTLLVAVTTLLPSACGTWDVDELDVYGFAKGCYAVKADEGYLTTDGSGFAFTAPSASDAARFYLQPSDLGTYLLYDEDGGYLVGESTGLQRETSLESDISRIEDGYVSGAEWLFETAVRDKGRYQLRSRKNSELLVLDGLTDKSRGATPLSFEPTDGCTPHPEIAVDATGEVERTTFEDGDLYGIVDAHSHMFTNLGFGGGLFHGSPFHRLGVEHALPDCALHHGEKGRTDFFGYAYDAGNDGGALGDIIPDMLRGELSEDNHATEGYPEFTEWPNSRKRSTHQVQYYRWLERAYLSGLRLVVQHATSNAVICKISVGEGYSPSRYDCEDMTGVDRQIRETYALERYIDAQSGGPGQGWFRVVTSPAEAREVIGAGKMAVVLGIETSDLFDCKLTPNEDGPVCDEAYVDGQLELYHQAGVRALFPVHKYDNAFTPGDGSGDFIEVGNFLNSGHYTNMTEDCPEDVGGRDDGPITFGGIFQPRDSYLAEAPEDFSDLQEDPIRELLPYFGLIQDPPIEGNWCQNATITPLGEHLMTRLMQRGMIIELDHFPQWSYKRAFEMLEENGYPGVGTHGSDHGGRLYEVGGLSFRGFGRCHDVNEPGTSWRGYQSRLEAMTAQGQYPALGLAFDFNGFAGGPGPRFGPDGCANQENPITYPFQSHDGAVEFTEPVSGERAFDFNTEGMVHIGLLPEYIENARKDAVSEDDLDPLFRSAEGYIRMWERAEARGRSLSR